MSIGKIILTENSKGIDFDESAKAPKEVFVIDDRINTLIDWSKKYSTTLDLKNNEYNEFYFKNVFFEHDVR